MGFANSVIGGAAALIRAAIRSPNFVTAVSGWSINKDGSAEFNGLTIRGVFQGTNFVVNQAGLFVYNGAAAKGTLILAIAEAAGTDAVGNNFGQGFNVGVWSAITGNQLQHFGIDNNGKVYVANTTGATVTFIDSTTGALLGYDSSGQVPGHLQASVAPAAGTDSAGNDYVQGLSAYAAIAGTTYAIRLGESSISGSNVPGLFLINQTGPAPNEAPLFSFGNASSAGTAAEVYSGTATPGSTASFIECADSTLSGTPGGAIVISSGNFSVDAAGNVTMGNLLTLTPKMATPPNTAAVKAGTATLAQTEACLGALIQSMQNRGMISL
jgi:hypothetical protein